MRVLLTTFLSAFFLVACNDSSKDVNQIRNDPAVTGVIDVNGSIEVDNIIRAEVKLIDYSIADAETIVVSEKLIESISKFPLDYFISYKEADINESRLYSVSASLIFKDAAGEEYVGFRTTQSYPVLTNGFTSEIDLLLESVTVQEESTVNVYISTGAKVCSDNGLTLNETQSYLTSAGIDVKESNCGHLTTQLASIPVCGDSTYDVHVYSILSDDLSQAENIGFTKAVSVSDNIAAGSEILLTACKDS
ncbi:YbaY family lipoprotein [Psychromonas aquimarina]|uniref:YbaY family lipoprotein n=1 Tax=Psychromonas aquimarina TaxID=444919 RepID=UPI0003F64E5B|nr:YbaY family lipoprotein [Psychromonas aquimarina]